MLPLGIPIYFISCILVRQLISGYLIRGARHLIRLLTITIPYRLLKRSILPSYHRYLLRRGLRLMTRWLSRLSNRQSFRRLVGNNNSSNQQTRGSTIVVATGARSFIWVYRVSLYDHGRVELVRLKEYKHMPVLPAVCGGMNCVFILGGKSSGEACKSVIMINLDEGNARYLDWTMMQTLHRPRNISSGLAWNDDESVLLIHGGLDPSGEAYSRSIGSWVLMNNDLPIENHQVICCGSRYYSLGGREILNRRKVSKRISRLMMNNENQSQQKPEKFFSELLRGEWLELSPMMFPREHFCCFVCKSSCQIVVIGGSDGSKCLDTIEVYCTERDVWKLSNRRLSCARKKFSLLHMNATDFQPDMNNENSFTGGLLLLIGGYDSADKPVKEIEFISVNSIFDERDPFCHNIGGILECSDQWDSLTQPNVDIITGKTTMGIMNDNTATIQLSQINDKRSDNTLAEGTGIINKSYRQLRRFSDSNISTFFQQNAPEISQRSTAHTSRSNMSSDSNSSVISRSARWLKNIFIGNSSPIVASHVEEETDDYTLINPSEIDPINFFNSEFTMLYNP